MARPKGKGHRVALTLNQETNDVFDKFAELSGTPKAALIRHYLEQILPILKETVSVMEQVKSKQMTPEQMQLQFINLFANTLTEFSKPIEIDKDE